jgi:hypothetical protein
MSTMRRATSSRILSPPGSNHEGGSASDPSAAPSPGSPALPPGARANAQASVAAAFVLLLLVLATTSQGAFAVDRWAPLALFALAVLIGALLARGSLAVPTVGVRVALVGIWGLAGWSMLSMVWSQSAGDAFLAGDRAVLYAAIATLPFVLPLSRRSLAWAGWALTAGIGVVAGFILIRLLVDGSPVFLAGRLNGPVNYRNATALLFALPVWPAVVAASARSYRRGLRAAALALGTLCLGLAFLTQSRGILIGLGAGGMIVLSLGPDRVRRAWTGALVIAAIAAASPWLLRPFHAFDGGHGTVTAHEIAVAGTSLALATAAAFVVGLAIALFDNGLRSGSPQMRHVRRAARLALIACVVVGVIGAAIAIGNPATYVSRKWDQFRSLQSTTPTTTRLLTTGGQRYDLWRVALTEFAGAPVIGVGADNYAFGYYRSRANNRNLDDPHSLVFALLSEDGIVGTALFVLFLGGIAGAMRSGWRGLEPASRRPAAATAAVGAVLVGQSTVDWMWLIPGLTAIGIFALSLAAAQVASAAPRGSPRAPARPVRIAVLAVVAASGLAVLALVLSDAYIQRARSLVGQPRAELSAARTAAAIDPWSVTPHYLEASASESLGDRRAAYAQLRQALSLEPQNSATLGVLGDFEARAGHLAVARSYYRRALALDPLDTGLQQLTRLGLHRAATARRR